MRFGTRKVALALGLVLGLAACGDTTTVTGAVPSDDQLEAVVVGRDTRTTVRTILGEPGSTGLAAEEGWLYVRSTFEGGTYSPLVEVDREVVAVSFDPEGVVTNVERFGLEDGNVVVLSRRVTDENTAGIGFLRQVFGNLGRFDPALFIN